tara:strand:+ start:559 stop:786 length:228 start_codon:yes stop_codon:yes gene_type:complete
LVDDIVNDHCLLFQSVVISLFLLFGLVIINYAILDSFVLIPVPCLLLMSLLGDLIFLLVKVVLLAQTLLCPLGDD